MKLKDLLTKESYNWMKFANEDDSPTQGISQNTDPANVNPGEESNKSIAAQKADALHLTALPYGNYADSSGKVVAKSVKGGSELVRITPHDDRENPENSPSDSSGAGHFKDDDFQQEPTNRYNDDRENPDYAPNDSSGAGHFKDDDFSQMPVAGRFDKDAEGEPDEFPQQPAKHGYNDSDLRKADADQNADRTNAAMFHQSHAAGQKEIPDQVDDTPVDVGTSAKEKEPPGYKINNDPNVGLHGPDNIDPSVPGKTKLADMIPKNYGANNEPNYDAGEGIPKSSAAHTYPSTNVKPNIPTDTPDQAVVNSHQEKLAKGVLSKANYNYDLARRSLYKALQKHPEKEMQYKKIAAELNRLEKADTSFIDNLAKQLKANRAEKIAKSREKYPQARINPNKNL